MALVGRDPARGRAVGICGEGVARGPAGLLLMHHCEPIFYSEFGAEKSHFSDKLSIKIYVSTGVLRLLQRWPNTCIPPR